MDNAVKAWRKANIEVFSAWRAFKRAEKKANTKGAGGDISMEEVEKGLLDLHLMVDAPENVAMEE